MNYRFIFLCLCLIFVYNVNAQSNVELKLLDQQRILELESQESQQANLLSEQESPLMLKSLADDDDDGMDDDWEIQHGLDPNDPRDAWQDADGDYILNLFEAQLVTDPNDAENPTTIDFNNSSIQGIEDALDMAGEQKVVIRLSEGEYFIDYLEYYSTDFYIMVQGGWNEDFTMHDPDTYRTILNGQGNEAISIGGSSSGGINYSAIIYEGIEFTNSGNFSLGGGIQFYERAVTNKTSIYDCQFYGNNYFGIGIVQRGTSNNCEFFLVNTGLYNNPSGGIYTQVNDMGQTRWRILNTTIHNPNSSEAGIDGLTSQDGQLHIDMYNSINWGNDNYAFDFFANDILSIIAKTSNVDNVDPDISDYTEFNNLMTDPLFVDVANNDLSLMENSPCIDAGADFGLPYAGNAPDIGSEEYGLIINTSTVHEQPIFSLIPNILQAGNRQFILDGLPDIAECTVYIFDKKGSIITQNNMTTNGGQIHYSIADHLAPGTYFITVDYDGHRLAAQRLVIAE